MYSQIKSPNEEEVVEEDKNPETSAEPSNRAQQNGTTHHPEDLSRISELEAENKKLKKLFAGIYSHTMEY